MQRILEQELVVDRARGCRRWVFQASKSWIHSSKFGGSCFLKIGFHSLRSDSRPPGARPLWPDTECELASGYIPLSSGL